MTAVVPFLTFQQGDAAEAMTFYVSIFPTQPCSPTSGTAPRDPGPRAPW